MSLKCNGCGIGYHFSVFREGQNWVAQVLHMPDEKVVRLRVFRWKPDARKCLAGWRGESYIPPGCPRPERELQ